LQAALLLLLAGCGPLCGSAYDVGVPQPTLEQDRLIVGGAVLVVEVARTNEQIQRGLMHRTRAGAEPGRHAAHVWACALLKRRCPLRGGGPANPFGWP